MLRREEFEGLFDINLKPKILRNDICLDNHFLTVF